MSASVEKSGFMVDLFGLGATVSLLLVIFSPLWWIISATVAAAIAGDRGRNWIGFFLVGLFFLGPLAIAVALLAAPGQPRSYRPYVPSTHKAEPESTPEKSQRGLGGFIQAWKDVPAWQDESPPAPHKSAPQKPQKPS